MKGTTASQEIDAFRVVELAMWWVRGHSFNAEFLHQMDEVRDQRFAVFLCFGAGGMYAGVSVCSLLCGWVRGQKSATALVRVIHAAMHHLSHGPSTVTARGVVALETTVDGSLASLAPWRSVSSNRSTREPVVSWQSWQAWICQSDPDELVGYLAARYGLRHMSSLHQRDKTRVAGVRVLES